jgi:ABC-type multidrug transport system permease subunit
MKKFKIFLLFTYFIIEILAIVFYINKEINSKVLILISISMSLMIGLYFYNRSQLSEK